MLQSIYREFLVHFLSVMVIKIWLCLTIWLIVQNIVQDIRPDQALSTWIHWSIRLTTWNALIVYFYRLPSKFRESNVFSRVCASFCSQGLPHVTTTNDTIGQSQVTPRFGLVHLGLPNPLPPGGPPPLSHCLPLDMFKFFHWGPPPPPHLSKLVYYISQTCWQTGGWYPTFLVTAQQQSFGR